MLTQRFKIELCRPVEACIMSDSPLHRVSPYADLCRPFPTSRDKSRLAFDNEFGSTCISLPYQKPNLSLTAENKILALNSHYYRKKGKYNTPK